MTLKVDPKATVILKIVPEVGHEFLYTLEKSTKSEGKGKPLQKFDAAVETIFRIRKCFQRSK